MRARYFIRISGTRVRCAGNGHGVVPLACEDWVAELAYPLNLTELGAAIIAQAERKGVTHPELDLVQRLGVVEEGGQGQRGVVR